MRVPHVVVDLAPDAARVAGDVALPAETQRHLRTVLRLRPGAPLTVTDGRGGWAQARLTPDAAACDVWDVAEAPSPVTLHPSLAKGAKLDLVIEKATELGVTAILPVVCERSERRWDAERAARQLARWTTIARGAVEQSHGRWLPRLAVPVPFDDVLVDGDAGLICHTALGPTLGEAEPAGDVWASPAAARVLVGPEGGFTPAEVDAAIGAGWRPVSLGPRVVRTETASLLVAVLAGRERGRFDPPAAP